MDMDLKLRDRNGLNQLFTIQEAVTFTLKLRPESEFLGNLLWVLYDRHLITKEDVMILLPHFEELTH